MDTGKPPKTGSTPFDVSSGTDTRPRPDDLTSKAGGATTKAGDTIGKTPGGRTTAFDTATSPFDTKPAGTSSTPLTTSGKTHKVQEGDTLWALAEEYYKNGSKWKLIEEANKDKLGTSNFLKKGMDLVIPDLPAATPSHGKETPGAEKETVGPGEYKIKEGDVLSTIAKEQLGSAQLWEEIDKANKDKPGWNPNMLKVGTVIRIPPKPEKAEKREVTLKPDKKPELKEEAVPPEFAGKRTYRIKKGDNPWVIAEKELGSGTKYNKILELNKGRIDPNNLKVGQVIVLPEESPAPAPR
jgi:nucleoid-associated protein YgaU